MGHVHLGRFVDHEQVEPLLHGDVLAVAGQQVEDLFGWAAHDDQFGPAVKRGSQTRQVLAGSRVVDLRVQRSTQDGYVRCGLISGADTVRRTLSGQESVQVISDVTKDVVDRVVGKGGDEYAKGADRQHVPPGSRQR